MHEIWTVPENQGYQDGTCVLFHALLYLIDISGKFSELNFLAITFIASFLEQRAHYSLENLIKGISV